MIKIGTIFIDGDPTRSPYFCRVIGYGGKKYYNNYWIEVSSKGKPWDYASCGEVARQIRNCHKYNGKHHGIICKIKINGSARSSTIVFKE